MLTILQDNLSIVHDMIHRERRHSKPISTFINHIQNGTHVM